MINKKIFLLTGAGVAAVSVAIAITINVIVKPTDSNNISDHLTCQQLQQAIDNLDRPPFNQLPATIRNDIEWIMVRDFDCQLNGKNWILKKGKLQPINQNKYTNTTDGTSIMDGIK